MVYLGPQSPSLKKSVTLTSRPCKVLSVTWLASVSRWLGLNNKKRQNMKSTLVPILCLMCNLSQIAAQTATVSPARSQLTAAVAVRVGLAERNKYIIQKAFPLSIYLKGGKSTNISLSMGNNYMGFNLQYLNDRFDVDIDKTLSKTETVTGLELPYTGQKRLQSTGFLLGPYFGAKFGKKKRFRAEITPAIGMVSTTSPSVKVTYINGGFSFPGAEIQTRLVYSIGLGVELRLVEGLAIGASWRATFNETLYSYVENSDNVFVSLSYRLPL